MLSKVLSLDKFSCAQIWDVEKEKDRGKDKVGDRPAKFNEKKSEREPQREIKNKGDIFVAATKVKMSGSKKKSEQAKTYDISSVKRVTRKFHVVVVQSNGKEMYKRGVLHVQSFFFAN